MEILQPSCFIFLLKCFQELFGDVGPIRSIQMVKPGTAAIDFYDENDAEKACDLYHNRLLDGKFSKY